MSTSLNCPLHNCKWAYVVPVGDPPLAGYLRPENSGHPQANLVITTEEIEKAIKEHMRGHLVADFLQTIKNQSEHIKGLEKEIADLMSKASLLEMEQMKAQRAEVAPR